MKIATVSDVVSGPNAHHVDARKAYDSPHATAVVITLQPGEALKRHVTPVDVFFYVLEGAGTVEIGDERETVGPGCVVESPARISHRWINEGDALFRVLVSGCCGRPRRRGCSDGGAYGRGQTGRS